MISGLQKEPTLITVQQISFHGYDSEASAKEEFPSLCVSKSIANGSDDGISVGDNCGDDPQALCVSRAQLNLTSSKGYGDSLNQEG